MEKVYVARVLGRFPAETFVTHAALEWNGVTHHAAPVDDPVAHQSKRQAAGQAMSGDACGGKLLSASTSFRLLSVAPDGLTSLVECRCAVAQTLTDPQTHCTAAV